MGVFTGIVSTAAKPVKGAFDAGMNGIKKAIATNQYDDMVDPERGILAKAGGIVVDTLNIATFNAARGIPNLITKKYDGGAVKDYIKSNKSRGLSVTSNGMLKAALSSEKGREKASKRVLDIEQFAAAPEAGGMSL